MKKCIEDVTSLQLRLKKVVGQLNGIQKMLAEDVPCEDILTQLNAVNGALHRISFMILDGHLRHCVREENKSRRIHLYIFSVISCHITHTPAASRRLFL